ncbi:MAG: DMT family transporter [Armatimonadota bacterium]
MLTDSDGERRRQHGSHPEPPATAGARADLRPYAYVLAGVLLGGLSPVFTKLLLLQDVEGPTIVAARYLLTVLFLLPFGIPRGRREGRPPGRRAWITLLLVGAFGSGLGALLFTAALDLASAGVANAISKTAPIFVALFSYMTLREHVTYLRFLLVAVMVGADVLIAAGELTFSGQLALQRLLGDLLALGAGITRAAAEILGKSALRQFRPSTVALWRFGVGLVVAAAVSAGTGGYASLVGLSLHGWVILLALAGVSTALYMTLYYRGLAEIPAHVAVSLKLLGAVVTVVVSWVVLHEGLTPYHIAGVAVLISGAYLLVMRTAQPAPQAARLPRGRRPWARLRPRLIALVIALVLGAISVVWYLSVRHSIQLLQQQVQLTVGEVAAILVEFGGLEERPSWQSYEQYLRRVVGHRVEGRLYALEVVYVAALDARGNIGAFAAAPELQVVQDGRPYAVRDHESMRQLLTAMEDPDKRHAIITATAQLISEGQPVGSLKMGCKREMSEGMVGEIVGRSAVAALSVLLLAAAITALVVGGMLEPIERLAAELCAGGDAEGTDRAQLDEIEQIRRALGIVSQAVGIERATLAAISLQLAQSSSGAAAPQPPADGVWLYAVAPPQAAPPKLAAVIQATAREVARQDGALASVGAGRVLATWPGERDDALRAVLAALAVSDDLGREGHWPVTILVGTGKDARDWEKGVAAGQTHATRESVAIVMGCLALADAREHVLCDPLPGAAGFVLVRRHA